MSTYPRESDRYDGDAQLDVLRMIAERAPSLAADALTATRVSDAASRQMRLDRLVPRAIADVDAHWTATERAELVAVMHGPGRSSGDGSSRDAVLRVRITEAEQTAIAAAAEAAGMSMSEWARWRMLG